MMWKQWLGFLGLVVLFALDPYGRTGGKCIRHYGETECANNSSPTEKLVILAVVFCILLYRHFRQKKDDDDFR